MAARIGKGRSLRNPRFLAGVRKVHLIGIGGSGMSGIAQLLLELGYSVSGSDIVQSDVTRRLSVAGVKIYKGHSRENFHDVDLVIFSTAVSVFNPELICLMRKGIPCFPRTWFVSEMMNGRSGVAIAGTHGKSTTTAMVCLILSRAGLDPGALLGAELDEIGSNAFTGSGKYFVVEADESDGSFLDLSPELAVVTGIDDDHLDYYGGMSSLIDAFTRFCHRVYSRGGFLACSDHPNNRKLLDRLKGGNKLVYGLGRGCDITAKDIKETFGSSSFTVFSIGRRLGRIELSIPGEYNIYNALGAVSVSEILGISFDTVRDTLRNYRGAKRRFQIRGEEKGVLVVEDYAHHPTEISLTLKAAKRSGRRIVALFQPHRYTRTKFLVNQLGGAFHDADFLIVTDIYPANEEPISGVSSRGIVKAAREESQRPAFYIPDMKKAIECVKETVKKGDLVLVLGAGDINRCAAEILKALRKKELR